MYILSQKPLALFAACAFKSCVPQVFSCFYSNMIRFSSSIGANRTEKSTTIPKTLFFILIPRGENMVGVLRFVTK